MNFKKLERNSADVPLLEKLNNQAFPENERIDIDDIFSFSESDGREVIGIYTDNEFSGFIVTMKFRKCVYICYLAICSEKRSKGIGGRSLKMLKEYYPDCQIVVDFEAPDEHSSNNAQRIRRRNFYYRNDFYETGYYQFYMETEFEIACNKPNFDKAEFERLIAEIHSKVPDFNPHLYRRN